MTTKSFKGITADISEMLAQFSKDMPEVMKGFSSLAQAATKDGALDKKTKELIALFKDKKAQNQEKRELTPLEKFALQIKMDLFFEYFLLFFKY